jgi:hypothetical protein
MENKNITFDKIIKDKNILELIIKTFENDIKKDIQDENLKYESNNTSYNNVYGKYLKNNQIVFPLKIPQKNFSNYNEFKKIENNFIFLTEKYKNENSKERKSTIYRKKKPKLKLDEKKITLYWKKISEKLAIINKISSFFLLKSIIKLNTERILEKSNNNINIRKELNLKDKILIYKILLKSKNKSSIFNNKRKIIKGEDNKTYENDKVEDMEKIKINNLLKKNITPVLNSNSNSKYYFSLSSNLNMKNLDEIIDIEDANIKIYKKQKIMKTQLTPNENFIDEIFPPSKTLFGVNKINSSINIGRIEDIFLSGNNNNNAYYAILPEKDEFDKNNIIIIKGLWKDYYFLDVIYSLLKYPSIIYKLFPSILRAKNGLYGINLRINGTWKLILIDDYVPYLVDQQYNKLFCYSSLNDSFIWLSLLEKAYSKLCGGYDKIQDGEVTEILDILTDTCTEKYELVCFNKLYLISKLKQDININKYIVFAKANNKTSYNIGLLQDGNYLIEEIKVFKKGETNEYALKMRNNFSDKIYRGVWGKDNQNKIPFLKNEIPENDTEFYISIDELIKYFSSLYICKIHPIENGNEYFSEYIHYSKNEVNFPNIAVIDISNDTNIIIQFHQKNPKFNINTFSVTSYMIITDIDYEYIDSVSSVDSNYSIELNLKKGKYFLISDIIYRYIFTIDNYHGYTINTYSKEKINLLKNNENNLNLNINHKEIITNAVINYSNKSLAPKRHELDLDIYEQNLKNRNKFPFLFILFDNSSSDFDKNINIKINNINNSITKNYAYYLDFENLNSVNINEDEINDSLSQKEIKLIMVLKLKEQFNFKINYHITPKITEEQLIEYTKIYGVSEELDEEGKIIQYLIEYDDGFIVLIENKYDNELFKMKLIMTGLICLNTNSEEQENVVYFDLNGEETKFFKLKTKDNNNSGVVSFQFQFAD